MVERRLLSMASDPDFFVSVKLARKFLEISDSDDG